MLKFLKRLLDLNNDGKIDAVQIVTFLFSKREQLEPLLEQFQKKGGFDYVQAIAIPLLNAKDPELGAIATSIMAVVKDHDDDGIALVGG